MLNKVAIQRVQSAYSKGIQSSSSRLSPRHIFNVLCTNRAKFLVNEQKKGQRISEWAYQNIPYIELEEFELNNCTTLLKSKHKIPAPMTGRDRHLVIFSTEDGSTTPNETKWENLKFKSGNKYTSQTSDFVIKDGYLYVSNMGILGYITARGLFEDPIAVYNFPREDGQIPCLNHLELEFPFEEDLMDALIEMASNELIAKFNSSREDITNNAQDSVINETK